MPKSIAVVSYDLNPSSTLTSDAVVVRDRLISGGYSAALVHQWALNETNPATFKKADDWKKYDGIVVCNFYGFWNLRELVRSARPVMCLNVGYVDDLSLGERQSQHVTEDVFQVVNSTHPIITAAGLSPGTIDIGNPVWLDSTSTLNHHVDVLLTTLASQAVLAAHKTERLSYFGWYRMAQASSGSQLLKLLKYTANWTFSGP
jgi:hypothetical protein